MSRPRFFTDHDFNENIVQGVLRREPTIEFVRAREVGLDATPDDEVLAFAAEQHLIVLSHDVNTMTAAAHARLAAGQSVWGLFMVKQLDSYAPVIESVLLVALASEAEEWNDRVTILTNLNDGKRKRQSFLPRRRPSECHVKLTQQRH